MRFIHSSHCPRRPPENRRHVKIYFPNFANDTITYGYDALGRITSRAINGVGQSAGYDALGRVTVWTNALGSFTNVYVGATGLIATNYAPFGKKTIFSYLDTTHDQRLQTIWNQNVDGSTLSKFDYAYDALGNITNWTQQVDNTATNVWLAQYDPVNQLLAVTVRGNTIAGAILKQYAYGYDLAGNRTSEQIGNGTGASPVALSCYELFCHRKNCRTGVVRFLGVRPHWHRKVGFLPLHRLLAELAS